MADPWLTIIGIGEDGLAGLPDASRSAITSASCVFGGPRHLALAGCEAKGQPWPVPFSVAPVLARRGEPTVILASGDPFWFGAGSVITRDLAHDEWQSHPAPSTFALAANRLGWPLEQTLCFGLHAAPYERLRPVLAANQRILCTLKDGDAPTELARYLGSLGVQAELTILEALGGKKERIRHVIDLDVPAGIVAPVMVALDISRAPTLSRAGGLPDTLFVSDGQITKRPVRALTLSQLAPVAGEHLWDIGAGSGSISMEWCLAGGTATAIEPRADRIQNIEANAQRFGLGHKVLAIAGKAPDALADLPAPHAIFVGGGGSAHLFDRLLSTCAAGTRLVANSVTLETEALLTRLHKSHGGDLWRYDIAHAEPLGPARSWKATRPITQWSVTV